MTDYLLIDNLPHNIDHSKLGKISRMVESCINKKFVILAAILHEKKKITVGDMIYFRDELIGMGFKLWRDFSIKKLKED